MDRGFHKRVQYGGRALPCSLIKTPLDFKIGLFYFRRFAQFGAELGHLQKLRSFCDIIGDGESMVNTCLR